MTKFKHVEHVDGQWLSGRIEPVTKITGGIGGTTRTDMMFKADMRDLVDLDAAGVDALILELQVIKEKMLEMDLEINPPAVPPMEPAGN